MSAGHASRCVTSSLVPSMAEWDSVSWISASYAVVPNGFIKLILRTIPGVLSQAPWRYLIGVRRRVPKFVEWVVEKVDSVNVGHLVTPRHNCDGISPPPGLAS